jgi:hypothetical protein
MNGIRMDTSGTRRQVTPALFSFRIVDNHMDWSTRSGDTTHLPLVVLEYAREVACQYRKIE